MVKVKVQIYKKLELSKTILIIKEEKWLFMYNTGLIVIYFIERKDIF